MSKFKYYCLIEAFAFLPLTFEQLANIVRGISHRNHNDSSNQRVERPGDRKSFARHELLERAFYHEKKGYESGEESYHSITLTRLAKKPPKHENSEQAAVCV